MKMFGVCDTCKICEGSAKHEKIENIKNYRSLVSIDYKSNLLVIGSFLDFQNIHINGLEIRLKLENIFDDDYSLSFAARCSFEKVEDMQMILDSCSVYTRFLIPSYNVFLVTKDAWEQISFSSAKDPKDFTPGEMFKNSLGVFICIKDLQDWTNDDMLEYKKLYKVYLEQIENLPKKNLMKEFLKG